MSITRVSEFSENSFKFEDSVRNRSGSKKIGLVAEDGGPLLLRLKTAWHMELTKTTSSERKIIPFR